MIDTWLEEVSEGGMMPIQSDNLAEIMATAAFSVLLRVADVQDYLTREKLLVD